MKARRPSSRTHRMKPDDSLNLTPLIDVITTLMFFLLIFAAVMPVAIIDAPLPKIASNAEEVKKAIDDKNKLDVNVFIDSKGFRVRSSSGAEKVIPVAGGAFPYSELHKVLVALHAKRTDSKEITLMPQDDVKYSVLIEVMDASRELVQGDEGYQNIPPEIANKPESMQFNRLFSDVSIGGV